MSLTNSQIRYLRGLAHGLNPIILVGNKGVTPALIKEFGAALDQQRRHWRESQQRAAGMAGAPQQASHYGSFLAIKKEAMLQIDALAEAAGAEVVQRIGHVASYFRRNAEAPKIALPR